MIHRVLLVMAALGPLPAMMQPPAMARDPVPSRIVRVVEFEDFGHVFRVDTESGQVTKTRVADVQPLPDGPSPKPTPTPNPPPVPVAGKPAWVILVTSQSGADNQWRDSEELRDAAEAANAKFRAFLSGETEVDEYGYRRFVAELGAPCIVVVDTDRKIMFARKLASLADAVRAVREMR